MKRASLSSRVHSSIIRAAVIPRNALLIGLLVIRIKRRDEQPVYNSLCASRKNTVVVSRIIVKFGSAAWLTLFQQKVLDFLSSREYRETVWNRCWFSFSHVTNMKFWKKIRILGPKTETKSRRAIGNIAQTGVQGCDCFLITAWVRPIVWSSNHVMVCTAIGLTRCSGQTNGPDSYDRLIRTEKSRNILHSCQLKLIITSDKCPFTNSTTKEWVQAQKHW